MIRKAFTLLVLTLMSVGICYAEDYTMPKKDGFIGTVTVTDPITFYDSGGASGDAATATAGHVQFVSESGSPITINFEEFNMNNAVLYLYDGAVEFNSYYASVPEGSIAQLTGENAGATYTAESGTLDVLYYYKSWTTPGAGWKATITAGTPKEMEFVGVTATQDELGSTYPGKSLQPLIKVCVETDGTQSPLTLGTLAFNLNGTTALSDLSNIAVYSTGGNGAFAATNMVGTAQASAQTLTYDVNATLKGGKNYFWLAADIDANATPMNKVDAELTSAIVGGEQRVSASISPEGNLNIDNVVCMGSTPQTYTVGDDPISFYDDGGKDGKVSENYNGSVTFKPNTDGKKVMIAFTNVELFESSNKNEILNVYNGSEVNEANFIARVMKGTTPTIHSTSADGALTVSMIADTGYPTNGFEATVSLFAPQAMEVESIAVANTETQTACAGDVDLPLLSVNINTINTEPALEVEKMTFKNDGNTTLLKTAKVYYTASSNAFGTKQKVGEATVNGGTIDVTFAEPLKLNEGANYLWLAADIDDNADNGQQMDLSAVSATLNGTVKDIANGNPEGAITVENVFYSTDGSTTKVINGSWKYKSSKTGNYAASTNNQTVTFKPATSGKIISIDFDKFDVYYSASSYGQKADFKIYDGTATSGTPIWTLDSSDKANVGPGTVRSSSADGCLTVVFNAKASSSYYTKPGWDATVYEYQPAPMEVTGVTASQANTGVVGPTATNEELIGFNVKAQGNLEQKSLSEVTIDLKGTQNNISKLYLYTSGKDSVATKENPIANAEVGENAKVTLSLENPVALTEGSNYFWLTFDVSPNATEEGTIDAAVTSVKCGGSETAVTTADPEGNRTVKNLFLLQAGNNGVVTIGDKSLMVYDCGGPDGNTPKNFDGYVTFKPEKDGNIICVKFTQWEFGGNDYMYFYYSDNGSSRSVYDLRYSGGTSAMPEPIKAITSANGELSFHFYSPSYSSETKGFAMEVSSIQPQSLSLVSATAESVNPANVMKGQQDVAMLHITANVEGEKGELNITDIATTVTGANSGYKIYCTDNTDSFATTKEFSDKYTVTLSGAYHFWVSTDVATDAAEGAKITAKTVSLTADGQVCNIDDAPTATATVAKGVSGNFTVGNGGDYATIAECIEALKGGIDGAVDITLLNDEYKELVTIPEIQGASAINTITMHSKSGNYNDCRIYYDQYTEPAYSDDKMAKEYGVFTLDGVDYFTLRGVSVTTIDALFPSVVHFRNKSSHCTIDSCYVNAPMSTSTQTDVNLIYQYAQNEANCNNDYATIKNCVIEGGYIGLRLGGTSYVRLPKQVGGKVLNNTFVDQGSMSVYVTGEIDLEIVGNVITNSATDKSDFKGIDFTPYNSFEVVGNTIELNSNNTATAIYMRKYEGAAAQRAVIANNEVRIIAGGSGVSSGIKLNSPASYVNIAHNTLYATTEGAGYAYPLHLNDAGLANINVVNNIIQNETNNAAIKCYKLAAFTGTTFSHNNYYTNGAVLANLGSDGGDVADFEAWKAKATTDTDSYNDNVAFVSSSILMPSVAANLVSGTKLDYVSTDITGAVRAAVPTIGAYEYKSMAEAPAMAEGYPVVKDITDKTATVVVKSEVAGKAYFLVKKSGEAAPTANDVVAAGNLQEMRGGKETTFVAENLSSATEYVAYAVLANFSDVNGAVSASETFVTSELPVAVSTFENVEETAEGFNDGTQQFGGCTVVEAEDAVSESGNKVAQIFDGSTITIDNSSAGGVAEGFFYKSDAPVVVMLYTESGDESSIELPASGSKWDYCNLKSAGKIRYIMFGTQGSTFIDDFAAAPYPLELNDMQAVRVNEGDAATLSVNRVSGMGAYPYTYLWTDENGNEIGAEATLSIAPTTISKYNVTVKDARACEVTKSVEVSVTGAFKVATFDEKELAAESAWYGIDPADSMTGLLSYSYSGSMKFPVFKHTPTWWSGFALSNETSTEFNNDLSQQFRSSVGNAHSGDNYSVMYVSTWDNDNFISITNNAEGNVIKGVYMTNAAYTQKSIIGGGTYNEKPFEKGNYYSVTVEGTHADGSKATVEIPLADYRSDNDADHYSLDTWEWFDLSSLGAVTEVRFSVNGNVTNSYGLLTPAYFCIDDFGCAQDTTEVTTSVILDSQYKGNVELTELFEGFKAEATSEYQIVSVDDESAVCAIDGNNLQITKNGEGLVTMTVRGKQCGKDRLIKLAVNVTKFTGVEEGMVSALSVYPNPADKYIVVSVPEEESTIEIYSLSGQCVVAMSATGNKTQVDVDGIEPGVYVVKVIGENTTYKTRFIKK